ncbi:MAG: hypothetical protein HY518_04740 [Candidatus Aenigmarchaeota archaeon]|nr:hypothetical protein [Candidatus Aenigmarchaeota archaeon]
MKLQVPMLIAFTLAFLPLAVAQPLCNDGDTRPCGSDVGICTPGTSACINGSFGGCSGGVEPGVEICFNDADDNCNTFTDECTVQFSPAIAMMLGGILILIFIWIVSRLL